MNSNSNLYLYYFVSKMIRLKSHFNMRSKYTYTFNSLKKLKFSINFIIRLFKRFSSLEISWIDGTKYPYLSNLI